jgi:hypothetical protein
MRAFGTPAPSACSAVCNCASSVAVGVMVETLDVHTSLAPIRIVTYSAPCETAVVT